MRKAFGCSSTLHRLEAARGWRGYDAGSVLSSAFECLLLEVPVANGAMQNTDMVALLLVIYRRVALRSLADKRIER